MTGNLSPDVANNIFSNASTSNATFLKGFSQGATLADLVATDPGFSPPSLYGAQKQTRNPTYLEWNLELQHALGQTTTLSLNYVGNHGVHEIFINPSLNAYAAAGFAGLPSTVPRLAFWASHRAAIGRNLSVSRLGRLRAAQLCPQLSSDGLLYLEPRA